MVGSRIDREKPMADSQIISSTYIVKTPGICGGRARIDGTRIGIEVIVGLYQSGASVDEIVSGYPDSDLTPAKVHAALVYYYDHREEIDRLLNDYQTLADEAHQGAGQRRAQQGLPPTGAYVTTHQAAQMLDVDHQSRRVAQLCRSGQLDCRKVGRDWLVSRESVENYAQRERKPGPNPK